MSREIIGLLLPTLNVHVIHTNPPDAQVGRFIAQQPQLSTPTPNPTTTNTIFVTMSDGQTKQFGKGQRTVPAPAQKAQKWYPVDDESQPKKVSIPRENTSKQ